MKNLIIESLVVSNFKSYEGEYYIKPFHDHLTCVVGPNGSGKSNIIDAILFVLGFKARKMRNTNIRDLINTNCSSCFVIVVFNHLSIKRSLDRTSGTKYFLKYSGEKDFRQIQLLELTQLLKNKYQLDLENNRFLILQGEIESISLLNPMELLKYIEDCIGTRKYIEEIERTESVYEKLKEELLLDQYNYELVRNEYSYKQDKVKERMEILNMKNTLLRIEFEICKSEGLQFRELSKKLSEECSEKEKIETEISLKHDKYKIELSKIGQIKKDQELEDKYFKLEHLILNNKKGNQLKAIRSNEIKEKIISLQKDIENTKYEKKQKEEIIDKLNSIELEILKSKDLIKKYSMNEEINRYNSKRKEIENKLVKYYENVSKRDENANYLLQMEQQSKQIKEEIEKIKRSEINNKISLDEIKVIEKDILLTKIEVEKRKRNSREFEYLDRLEKREREVVKTLKNMNGFVGQLKNLGIIPEKYEIAFEVACPLLKAIVVETTTDAEEMVKVINKRNLQRTVFIILEQIDKSNSHTSDVAIENQLLYRKVECEPRYVPCYYFALRDTIVAEDIVEAKRLAFGGSRRQRVVTTDGELLEKSGIMTGGNKPKRKKKSTVELEEILENMKNILDEKTREYKEKENREERISFLEEKLKNIQKTKKRYEENLQEVDDIECNNINDIQKELDDLEKNQSEETLRCKKDSEKENLKLFELENKQFRFKKELEGILSKNLMNNHQTVICRLKRELEEIKIIEINEDEFVSLKEKYNKMIDSLKEKQEQIREVKNKIEKIYKEKIENEIEINEIGKRIEENNNQCILIKKKIKNIKRELSIVYKLSKLYEETIEMRKNKKDVKNSKYLKTEINTENETNICSDERERENSSISNNNNSIIQRLKQKYKARSKEFEYSLYKEYKLGPEEIFNHLDRDNVGLYSSIANEYFETENKYSIIQSEFNNKKNKLEKISKELETLKYTRLDQFLTGFAKVNEHLKRIFSLITSGGNAGLDLVNYLDPFSDGIVFNVFPPKKAWKKINNLSGGEKTLSSISLIFALHLFNPSSFYIMDEIDAALDNKNVSIISSYISSISSQFIIISLRNNMFEKAEVLIGVYKNNNTSRFVSCEIKQLSSS